MTSTIPRHTIGAVGQVGSFRQKLGAKEGGNWSKLEPMTTPTSF